MHAGMKNTHTHTSTPLWTSSHPSRDHKEQKHEQRTAATFFFSLSTSSLLADGVKLGCILATARLNPPDECMAFKETPTCCNKTQRLMPTITFLEHIAEHHLRTFFLCGWPSRHDKVVNAFSDSNCNVGDRRCRSHQWMIDFFHRSNIVPGIKEHQVECYALSIFCRSSLVCATCANR